MLQGQLHGALGKPGCVTQLPQAGYHWTPILALGLGVEIEIHDKRGGLTIVPHEIPQENVEDIVVITEHGVAYLHGKTLRQRAEAMIQIAHPKFHRDLEEYALQHHLLTPNRATVAV